MWERELKNWNSLPQNLDQSCCFSCEFNNNELFPAIYNAKSMFLSLQDNTNGTKVGKNWETDR